MAYIDTHVLEADLNSTKHDWDVVALAGMDGTVGLLVTNQFGMTTDMEELAKRHRTPFTRLLVGVEDQHDPATRERVRDAVQWPDYPPF